MRRLALSLAIALAFVAVTTRPGLALAETLEEVCRIKVPTQKDPFPEGSEHGVNVTCDGRSTNFAATLEQGALLLVLRATTKTKEQIVANPMACTVEGPAFQTKAAFHCSKDPADAPSLSLKPVKWGIKLRFMGKSAQRAPWSLSVGGGLRTVDDVNETYMFSDAEISQLLHNRALEVIVKTKDVVGDLESTFTIGSQQYASDNPSRQKLLPLAVERCNEEPISYDLTKHGLTTDDLVKVPFGVVAQRKLEVLMPWVEQTGRPPRIRSMTIGDLNIVWPANHVCQTTADGQLVRLRLELPDLERRLFLSRDGGVKVESAPRTKPRGVGLWTGGVPEYRLRLQGNVPGGSPTVMVMGGGTATEIAKMVYRIKGRGERELVSLSKQIGRNCPDVAGILTCPIEDRADFTVTVWAGGRLITAPHGDPMTLDFAPVGHRPETLKGVDALAFPGVEAREQIDTWNVRSLPARFTMPGYVWRTASGDFKVRLDDLHIDMRSLILKRLFLEAEHLPDAVEWALRTHGWLPDSTWARDLELDRDDPVSLAAEELAKRNGRLTWEVYDGVILLLAYGPRVGFSEKDPSLHLHASASASFLRARTSSKDPKKDFQQACSKAFEALLRLPKDVALDAPVRADLELIRMQSCFCTGTLTKQEVREGIQKMGPAVDKHPHYLEPYLDLKADLDRPTPSICQPVPKYRGTR